MKRTELEPRMRALEYFHGLRLVPGAWTIIRLDGRGFSRFTAKRFAKPFDEKFHALMTAAAQAVIEDMQGIYAYTESDEISVLFERGWDMFDREVEKLVSLSASIASAAFSLACGEAAHFDSRICMAVGDDDVVDYFRWRQEDASRNALNGWCYWTLRQEGATVRAATKELNGRTTGWKNELLFSRGVNFNDLPAWQRRGTGIYHERYEKSGFDPIRQQEVKATRRRLKVDAALPIKDGYEALLRRLMHRAPEPRSDARPDAKLPTHQSEQEGHLAS